MQNDDFKATIIHSSSNHIDISIAMAESMTGKMRGIVIVGGENPPLPLHHDDTETIEPEIMKLHALPTELLDEIILVADRFAENEHMMHRHQKKNMQLWHDNMAQNALKNTRKPLAYQSRKF